MDETGKAEKDLEQPADPVNEALRRLEVSEPVPPLEGRAAELAPGRRFVGPEPWLRVVREG